MKVSNVLYEHKYTDGKDKTPRIEEEQYFLFILVLL